MKKIFLTFILGITTSLGFSQQALTRGNVIIDGYYGYSPWGANILKGVNNSDNFNAKVYGPFGGRAEYMIDDNFGIGIDFMYKTSTLDWTVDSTYDVSGTPQTVTTTHDLKINRIRPQLRFNFHMSSSNPMLDKYLGVGIGLNIRKFEYFKNEISQKNLPGLSSIAAIPVSARVCFGLRYYITENIGLNMEIGAGGPLFSGGLSLKL